MHGPTPPDLVISTGKLVLWINAVAALAATGYAPLAVRSRNDYFAPTGQWDLPLAIINRWEAKHFMVAGAVATVMLTAMTKGQTATDDTNW